MSLEATKEPPTTTDVDLTASALALQCSKPEGSEVATNYYRSGPNCYCTGLCSVPSLKGVKEPPTTTEVDLIATALVSAMLRT